VFDRDARGGSIILAGSSSYEDGLVDESAVRLYGGDGRWLPDTLPAQLSATGPVALADIDNDGDLDAFVGGRVIPGRYPEPASSILLRNMDGRFEVDPSGTQALRRIGMVSGAVFSDLNGDGAADLVLACDWGPVRVLQNRNATFTDITAELGLNRFLGPWNGVTTADLDGDGRLDIIASNWGRNTRYQAHRTEPLRLYHGNGTVEMVEAYFNPAMGRIVPERPRDALAQGLPFVAGRFPSHEAYGLASVREVLGDEFSRFEELQANTLESMIFLNRGGSFEPHALPDEAQWSVAFGICAADLDGDGDEDLFLSQNFFATQPETSPLASGRGIWLSGDGHGEFQPVSASKSGIRVYGEQRGAAVADYDHDGRVDLVVAQNAESTRLFRNRAARPGLRVRLRSGPANPYAVGAVVRLGFGERLGPVREIHAGSGYLSQDDFEQMLGTPEAPTSVWVRWPGGRTTTSALPADARDILVDQSGKLEIRR
jgi:hypothetical protein